MNLIKLHIENNKIEESNLNRQLFWTKNDIGNKKVLILQREIKKRYFSCNCEYISSMLSIEEILEIIKKYDLIILSADEPIGINEKIEKEIQNSSIKKVSIINAGYLNMSLSVSLYNESNQFLQTEKENINWVRHDDFIWSIKCRISRNNFFFSYF
ncbi:ThiF family adenylyltransferase [Malaciobacter mytili]|uniref:ThiF family adenylyltransferase n=1 Tax=Malaciobacter mytili TaxID=603050 RepID=UPI003A871C79